jgi:hypothetical protein
MRWGLTWSVSAPPMSGPMMDEIPKTAPNAPNNFGRSSRRVTCAMVCIIETTVFFFSARTPPPRLVTPKAIEQKDGTHTSQLLPYRLSFYPQSIGSRSALRRKSRSPTRRTRWWSREPILRGICKGLVHRKEGKRSGLARMRWQPSLGG